MTKVFRCKDGNIINIGEWEHRYAPRPNPNYKELTLGQAEEMRALEQNPGYLYSSGKLLMDAQNPLPEGATQKDETVDIMPDGSHVVVADYVTKRRIEYPSIADQLDNIYHNGITAWKADIKTIKDKYPKS